MKYDVIVVGGGISGLTAAAYLGRDKYNVLLVEKGDKVGGLVSSFEYKGFTFDGGIRAIESSGVVIPMMRQLGIDFTYERSVVTLGIKDDVIRIEDESSLVDYQNLLIK